MVYQLVASTPERTEDGVKRVADNLGESFQIDLGGLLDSLSTTGVCVTMDDSPDVLREYARRVLTSGADFTIIDEEGNVVETGAAGADLREGTGAIELPAADGTLEVIQGGVPAADSTIGDGAVDIGTAPGKLELESDGGYAAPDSTIGDGALEIGNVASGPLTMDNHGGYAAPESTIGHGGIEVDGSDEELQLATAADFISPGESDDQPSVTGRLREVSTGSLVMIDGSTNQAQASNDQIEVASAAFRPDMNDMSTLDVGRQQPGRDLGFVDTDLGIESTGTLTDELPQMSGGAPNPFDNAATNAVMPQPVSASPRAARAPRAARGGGRQLGFKLFGGSLRYRPVLRVVLGFVLAVGASSGFAFWNADRVMTERIKPLRIDLSSVLAHGKRAPNYEPRDVIESRIASILRTNRMLTLGAWIFFSSLLLILWFRFT